MKTGMLLTEISELTMSEFLDLYRVMLRVEAREKVDHLGALRVAAHGEAKHVKELEKQWLKRGGDARRPKHGLHDFIRDIGGGF